MEQGGSGDRADLPFMPSRDAWDMVRSDADMCLGSKCPFFQKAPFYESRRQAAKARVLVVNQALLFSDLAMRSISGNYQAAAVIPPYQHVILDEAHSIEDIATDHFGQKFSSFGLRLTLGKFLSTGRTAGGVFHRLSQASTEHKAPALAKVLKEKLIPNFREAQEKVIGQMYNLSFCLHSLLNAERKRSQVIWLKHELLASGQLNDAREEAKELLSDMMTLVSIVRKVRTQANNQDDKFKERINGMLVEMEARQARLESTMIALKDFAVKPDENQVPWLELKLIRHQEEFEYKVSPLDVTAMLREALFKPFKSVTLTSATLNLDDNFSFLSSRNGLKDWDEKEWSFATFDSPFDFGRQARLYLTRLAAMPTQQNFTNDLADLVLHASLSGHPGGTLVLFTSYSVLNRVAQMVEGTLARAGVDLLVQGRASRSQLVERMKKTQGVLLGTDSFWEGVDLPGKALTKVIITKLPFRQMGDPIFEARCAAIDASGRSSFKEYSLPIAMLKFKQGAGRLIRHKLDEGVLIVADNRIRAKSYGSRFLSLLKTYPIWDLPSGDLPEALQYHRERS